MDGIILTENKVTMNLGEFLKLRDALKFKEEIEAFALDSRATYGDGNSRDVHDIGYQVLSKLNIPVKRNDGEELFG